MTDRDAGQALTFVKLDEQTYTAHADGLGAVYWINRSPVWGDQWQAFTEPDRRPVHRPRRYRADLFDACRVYWQLSDSRNPIHAEAGR